MKSQEKALRFFLGVNTPQGFVSRFDRISDKTGGWRTLIIKGGPGSGKSTLMKKIAEELKDEELELIHCSSDCDSLDAVICPARKFAIADGTAPHVDVGNIIDFQIWRFASHPLRTPRYRCERLPFRKSKVLNKNNRRPLFAAGAGHSKPMFSAYLIC